MDSQNSQETNTDGGLVQPDRSMQHRTEDHETAQIIVT